MELELDMALTSGPVQVMAILEPPVVGPPVSLLKVLWQGLLRPSRTFSTQET